MAVFDSQALSPNLWDEAYLRARGIVRNPRWVVVHKTFGTYPHDLNWMRNPEAQVSCHIYIRKSGERVLVVPIKCVAWHAYVKPGQRTTSALWNDIRRESPAGASEPNINYQSIGIELECEQWDDPTEAQVAALIETLIELAATCPRIKLTRECIIGHCELNTAKTDPNPWDWEHFMMRLLVRASVHEAEPLPPKPADPADPTVRRTASKRFAETGKLVKGGFWDWYQDNDGFARLGFPLTEEEPHPETAGVVIQVFENGWLEAGPGWVRQGACGRYYLKATGRL